MEDIARQLLPLLDLTSLNDDDSDEDIRRLCQRTRTQAGPPAAVCIHPHHVATAATELARIGLRGQVRVVTVANFPRGLDPLDDVLVGIRSALTSGADEIDVVFPYTDLLAGDEDSGYRLISRCRQATTGHVLKVILETGQLGATTAIRSAADIALAAGADFLKTSTGKVEVNATPRAAATMMEAIAASGRPVGFKAAGGIRTVDQAAEYLELARDLLGPAWLRPERLRFGASGLLDDILARLGMGAQPVDLSSRY